MSEVLIALGSDQAEIFTRYLSDPDPLVVRAMIGILLQADKDKPIERIARTLKHPDESVRIHGARVILENGDSSVGGLFIPLLEESSKQLLNIALQFFGKFSYPQAYENLVYGLSPRCACQRFNLCQRIIRVRMLARQDNPYEYRTLCFDRQFFSSLFSQKF